MKNYTQREIRDLLTDKETPPPPADLVGRIKSEIPDPFDIPRPQAEASARIVPFRRRMRVYLMAASLLVTTGGAFLAYRIHQQMTPQENLALSVLTPAVSDQSMVPAPTQIASESADSEPEVLMPSDAKPAPALRMVEVSVAEVPVAEAPVAEIPVAEVPVAEASVTLEAEREMHEGRQVSLQAEPLRESWVQSGERSGNELAKIETSTAATPGRRARMSTGFSSRFPGALQGSFGYGPRLSDEAASYAVLRRHLHDGHLPPPEAVRVEELINYFDYGDAPPIQDDVAIHAEGAPSPFGEGERYRLIRFHLRGREEWSGTLQVEFNPEVVSRHRLVGYENRDNDAGEIGVGHAVTALYEIKLHGSVEPEAVKPETEMATLTLRYGSVTSGEEVEISRTVTGEDMAETWESSSPALRLTTLVAEFGEILERSYWARTGSLDQVFQQAQAISVEFPGQEAVAEFVDLVGKASQYR